MSFFFGQIKNFLPIKYHFVIPANIKKLKTVMFNSEKFLSRYNIDEELIFKLRLCVSEVVSNAIEHGLKYNEKNKVSVLFKLYLNKKIIIIVKDSGLGFDAKKIKLNQIDKHKYRGRGLFLINKLADKLFIKSSKKGTRIKIIKYLNK